MAEQPPQPQQHSTRRGQGASQRGSGHIQHESFRASVLSGHQLENGEIAAKTRLNVLRSKFNVCLPCFFASHWHAFNCRTSLLWQVSINVPPRIPRGSDQITIRGAPDAVEACKAELAALEVQLQAEKADREARNYEEILNVEERYLSRIISGEKERLLSQYGVAIFTRGRAATTATAVPPSAAPTLMESELINGGNDPVEGPSTSNTFADKGRYAGYRLVSSVNVPLVLQGYKEKVKLARGELEKLFEKFASFTCMELHIPSEVTIYSLIHLMCKCEFPILL